MVPDVLLQRLGHGYQRIYGGPRLFWLCTNVFSYFLEGHFQFGGSRKFLLVLWKANYSMKLVCKTVFVSMFLISAG